MFGEIRWVIEMAQYGGVGLFAGPAGLRVKLAPLRVDAIADHAQALGAHWRNQLRHDHIAEIEPLPAQGSLIRVSHVEGL
jgi:hypothetical protein